MKRIDPIQSPLRKQGSPAGSRLWTASVFMAALLVSITLAFCQGQAISPEKAMMMGYVEDFFNNNFRNITARKTISWGELEKHDDGSVSIVYRYEATTRTRARNGWAGTSTTILDERRFVFDKDWKIKSWDRTEGFPQPVGNANEVERPGNLAGTPSDPGTAQSTASSPAPLDSEIDPKRVPKIVKMFPENGAKDVDPNISQVYLNFDIPMGSGRAWASNNADGTALDHDPDQAVFWTADGLTCVAPVKLQPNKRYVVYLNIRPFIGFASIAGVPSEGLTYSFETGSAPLDPQRREELAKGAFEVPAAWTKGRDWSPEQATGEPDAWLFKTGGDYTQAWASLTPDGQEEWLTLTWSKPVEAVGVDVYETYNPGALVRVVTYKDDAEVARWEGVDPTPRDAPNGKGISKIRFDKPVETNRMTLYLDSPNVPGWNEIDAVSLVDTSGAVHWATGATASSTYADYQSPRRTAAAQAEPVAEKERNWAAPEDQERVREVLRKMKEANTHWFSGAVRQKVESCTFTFHFADGTETNIDWNDSANPGSWYTEFYRKGISYIGVSRLLIIDIDGLRCTSVKENADEGTITFDFVLAQEWMNAVGNGISGSWRGWFNGGIGEGKAVICTKTNTPIEIITSRYDEKFFDYVEVESGKFVPKQIVIDYHRGERDAPSVMYFDFRFNLYEPGVWLFDRSIPRDGGEPVVWLADVQINGEPAVERKTESAISIENEPIVRQHALRPNASFLYPRIQTLLPEIDLTHTTTENPNRQYSVVVSGSSADHEKLEKAIAQALEEMNAEATLETYALTVSTQMVHNFIQPAFDNSSTPGFRMTMDEEKKLLFVMGRPIDHKRVKEALHTLEEASEGIGRLCEGGPYVLCRQMSEMPASTFKTMSEFFPRVRFSFNFNEADIFFAMGSRSELANLVRMLEGIEKLSGE